MAELLLTIAIIAAAIIAAHYLLHAPSTWIVWLIFITSVALILVVLIVGEGP